jgi:cysteine synthase B
MSVATSIVPPVSRLVSTNLLQLIGHTPLVRMERIASDLPGIEIYGKAEFFNPGGSVKDRAALNMILDGERTGKLTRDRVLMDSTSGNTGIAYAMIGAYRGYKVKLILPGNASMERKHVL